MEEDFATTLVTARQRRGITQAQLAVSAGLTPSYVCLLENRKKPPPSDTVCEALAAVLGVPARDLLEVAHLQRSPTTVQRRVRSLSGRLSREQRSRHRLLESLLSPLLLASPTNWIENAFEWIGGGAPRQRRLREVLLALGRRHQDRATAVARIVDELPERDRQLLLEAIPRILSERNRRAAAPAARTPELFYALPPRESVPDRPFLLSWTGKDAASGEVHGGDVLLVDPGAGAGPGDLVVSDGPDGAAVVRRLLPGEGVSPGAGDRALVVVEIRRPLRRPSP